MDKMMNHEADASTSAAVAYPIKMAGMRLISRRRFLAEAGAMMAALAAGMRQKAAAANAPLEIDADEFAQNAAKYAGKNLSIKGQVIHVCPVNGKKMKLRTANGNIIKIVSAESNGFCRSLNQKMSWRQEWQAKNAYPAPLLKSTHKTKRCYATLISRPA